ncbi:hypothetical protein EON83_19220 [bacterium]|nr:MAG: hypothetical protein EON83_19220 [bacterium]
MNNKQIIMSLYAAFAQGDIARITELLDEQFEITQTELLPWGGRYRGPQEAIIFLGKLTRIIATEPQLEEIVEAGEHLLILGRIKGHVRSNNQAFDIRFVHDWMVRDGKAVCFAAHIDTPKMLEALNA